MNFGAGFPVIIVTIFSRDSYIFYFFISEHIHCL